MTERLSLSLYLGLGGPGEMQGNFLKIIYLFGCAGSLLLLMGVH